MKGTGMLRNIMQWAKVRLAVIGVQAVSGLATGNYLTFLDTPGRVLGWMTIAACGVFLAWNARELAARTRRSWRAAARVTGDVQPQPGGWHLAGKMSPRYIGPPPWTPITEETALVLRRTVTWTGPQRVFADGGAVWAQGSPMMSPGLCGKCREPMRVHAYYGRGPCEVLPEAVMRLAQPVRCAGCGGEMLLFEVRGGRRYCKRCMTG